MNEKRKNINKKILKFGCLPIVVIFGLLLIIGIFADKDGEEESPQVTQVDNIKQRTEVVYKEFMLLYHELGEFKDEPDFIEYGFSSEKPYNKWMKSVEKLQDNPDSKLLLDKGIVVNDLLMLGMRYVSSKGEEDDITRGFNEIFSGNVKKEESNLKEIEIPSDVIYKIVEHSADKATDKRELKVEINKKVDIKVLEKIAYTVKGGDGFGRSYIYYFLPEQDLNSTPWAISHFTPKLELEILGYGN